MDIANLLEGKDVVDIAKKVLGAKLTTNFNGQITSGIIVETEAYRAPDDKGSHAFGNKRTKRTETLFAKAGITYVYLCYGIHHLVNIVTGPEETAHAVLLRAIEPIQGLDVIKERRGTKSINIGLTNGPGKLSQALGITTSHDGFDMISDNTGIRLTLGQNFLVEENIVCSPRVGIAYAEECAHYPWRFRVKNNKWTSFPHVVNY